MMTSQQHSSRASPKAPPTCVEKQVDLGRREPLGARFYGSRQASRVSPLVLHFHGGAFVSGSLEGGSCIGRLLAASGAVVMSLDYPLAPAHPFPQAVEAGYDALVWAWKARHKLAGHEAPMFVAGEEAGGNIAAAVTLLARDRRGPQLAGQILLSPMLDPCLGTASLRDVHAGPVGCTWADGWHSYLPRLEDASHPYAVPGSVFRLSGLPPTLLITAEDDPMRDETQAYTERLRAAGLFAHEVVLPGPTGWPGSYLDTSHEQAGWPALVQKQFSDFFASMAAAQSVQSSLLSSS
ncbi:alpha/beta hydrolase [Polaromonas sp. A23]|uniref:alpha/beta hydrolase n=1 Tax=Polaromonas sp. A23 TaxID=1944133 RepID=UPI0011157DA8